MIQFALIGAGVIGRVHAQNIDANPEAGLGLVFDVDDKAAEAVAREYRAKKANSVEDIVRSDEVDAVVIAASTDAHSHLAMACAVAGKPFLLEKPIDLAWDAACGTVEAVQAEGVLAGIGFCRRFDPQHQALKCAIDEGAAGRIELMRMTSRTQALPKLEYIGVSGGQLRDKGSHFFDLACWLSGERPREIYAAGRCLIEPKFAELGDSDSVVIVLSMESGAFCSLDFSRRTNYGYDERIEIFGSGGRVESQAPAAMEIVKYRGDQAVRSGLHQHWFDRFHASYAKELSAFIKEITQPTGTFPRLEDGLVAECIAHAGMQSMQCNAAVEIKYPSFVEKGR